MIEAAMRTRLIRKRLERLEKLMGAKYDEDAPVSITIEELCRSVWKHDKKAFEYGPGGHLASCFQAEEDAEAAENARRRLHAGK